MTDEQFLAECKSSLSSPAAFPTPILGSEGTLLGCVHGMSLRDWFAGMALQGFCSREYEQMTPEDFDKEIPRWCYESADAMLKARGQ